MAPKAKPNETLPLHGPSVLHIDRFSLTVVEGSDLGATVTSDARELSVGTAQGNQLVLTDPSVSRHHCSVTSTPKGFVLRDLGSTNGTSVGGCRVELGRLQHDVVLSLGRTKVRFLDLDEPIVEPLAQAERFGPVLGESPEMRRLFSVLPKIAASDTTVLIEGETGTGKGRMAEAIHEASPRAEGPFVVLDCAAIPASLAESELFGHERGAFTGAHADRAGAFEQAAGGTIFLDEVGELPLDMQPKLLRAIEDRTVKRVGGNRPIKLDVRIVAATNRDLREQVNRGTFRADLFFRLHVVRLAIPPLRERRQDIELLARHFYAQIAGDAQPPPDLLASLARQPWPGNVRELRSAVERAVLLGGVEHGGQGAPLPDAERAALAFDPEQPFRVAKERAIARWEGEYLRSLLAHAGGNISEAARIVSIDRGHLRDLLDKYGLRGR